MRRLTNRFVPIEDYASCYQGEVDLEGLLPELMPNEQKQRKLIMRQLARKSINLLQAGTGNCLDVEQLLSFPLPYSIGPPDIVETCKEQTGTGLSVRIIQAFITSNFLRGRGSEKAFKECQWASNIFPSAALVHIWLRDLILA